MSDTNFKTPKDLKDDHGISEVTQWRERYPRGPLEFYRIAGKIKYTPDQISRYLESKRVGATKENARGAAV